MISAEPFRREEAPSAGSKRIGPTTQRAQQSQIGRILCNRYRLEAELGSGSMGRVYRATDLKRSQRVAVKLVLPEAETRLQAHLRIANEAKITSRLYHPNIVSVQQFHRDEDGTELLVLELLDGMDLREYLNRYARMPLPRALEVLRGLGSALQYAHELGIAHCDIKPENVFLGRERTVRGVVRDTVKLLDFGLARLFSDDTGGENKDALGQALTLSTAENRAPELLKEGAVADPRADQWSLAVLAYELLSGQLPFRGQIPFELSRVICRTEPVPLGQLVPNLPRHVEQAVCRALAKAPERRFATVGHFLRALENPALLSGDTLGQVQPDLHAEDSTWVHHEDLAVPPAARPSDVLQTVQCSADELLALASQSLAGTSNVPQVISEDSPTKPYVVTEAELRCLADLPASPAVEVLPAPSLPAPPAPRAASAESSLPAESPPRSPERVARERNHPDGDRETCALPPNTEAEPSKPKGWPLSPQVVPTVNDQTDTTATDPLIFSLLSRRRRTPWLTIGAGSALFCLGFLLALAWTTRRPGVPHGHVSNAWQPMSTFATFYNPTVGNHESIRARESALLHPAS